MGYKRIEYMCGYCGKKEIRNTSMGRPLQGKCHRKKGNKKHTWIINRHLS